MYPELDSDGVRVIHKIHTMNLEEIKERIPRTVYAGILLAADILYNDHLRGRDPHKRREAADVFLSQLGQANFLKNLASLSAVQDEKNKKKPATATFGEEQK
jgi:hypothetical protein